MHLVAQLSLLVWQNIHCRFGKPRNFAWQMLKSDWSSSSTLKARGCDPAKSVLMPKLIVVLCESSSSLHCLPNTDLCFVECPNVLGIVIDTGYRCTIFTLAVNHVHLDSAGWPFCAVSALGCIQFVIATLDISHITDGLVHLTCDWQDCWLMTGYRCYILYHAPEQRGSHVSKNGRNGNDDIDHIDHTGIISMFTVAAVIEWQYQLALQLRVLVLCWTICEHQVLWLWCYK